MKRKLIAGVCAFVTAFSAAAAPDMTNHAALTASAVKLGDIDGNDTLNAADVKALANYLLTRSKQASGADLNSDGIVNAADLTLLKRLVLNGQGGGGSLRISEVCSTNKTALKAKDGTSPDWIEIWNTGDSACDLSGIGVSDGDKNRYKFKFPDCAMLGAGEYLIIFCDDTDSSTGALHAAFKISAAGETIYLTAADGTELDQIALPELDADITYGRLGDSFALLKPTPGASNDRAESFLSVSRTCLPVLESSAPVGSSAMMISGFFTSARAIATRCF